MANQNVPQQFSQSQTALRRIVTLDIETVSNDPQNNPKGALKGYAGRVVCIGLLFDDGGPSTTGTVGKLRMKGREVFRHAVVNLADVLSEVLSEVGLATADIDWVVPHQANARILDATARKLGLPPEKVVVTVDRHANTSAASVPLALDVAVRDGRIKRGDLLVLEAMGGGFTWGAAALRY